MVSGRFPFSAVVGVDEVKMALLLAALDPGIGGVLLRGQKGSAKTTLARGLAALLPGAAPFVELPVGATEDRVVGSLDLAAALTGEAVRFRPGLLAAAHGGVLYVDEVNLLPDHLVDALLDVAASGVNRVEREGIATSHPARFILIGSMNPEEGELRPQFLDRFGLAVAVESPADPALRALAVRRRLDFDADTEGTGVAAGAGDAELAARLERAAGAGSAALPDDLVERVARLCVAVGTEGLRADLVICRAAAALARWEGRDVTTEADVRRVAPMALAHRARRNPLDDHGIDAADLSQALDEAFAPEPAPGTSPPQSPAPPASDRGQAGDAAPASDQGVDDPVPPDGALEGGAAPGREVSDAVTPAPDRGRNQSFGATDDGADDAGSPMPSGPTPEAPAPLVAVPDAPRRVVRLEANAPARVLEPPPAGRRSVVEGPRGRLITDRAPGPGGPTSVAVAATVREAVLRRAGAPPAASPGAAPGASPGAPSAAAPGAAPGASPGAAPGASPGAAPRASSGAPSAVPAWPARPGGAPLVSAGDVREAVRQQRSGNLVILVIDASGSMGADHRMEAAKGAVLSLLVDAYQRRDRVALIAFREDGATVVLRPTASVEVARARLGELPTGGRTPLAAGILAATDLATRASPGAQRPLLVLVTDGRATAAPAGWDPVEAALTAAKAVRRKGLSAVVVDVESGPVRLGLAGELAEAMGGRRLTVPELTAASLAAVIALAAPGG